MNTWKEEKGTPNPSEEVKLAPTGKAKEALELYQERVRELEQEGRFKPDMIACSDLTEKGIMPERKHGELEGVPIGLVVTGRGDACILGIHQAILKGIDALKGESCYAVCMSGGYVDDDEGHRPDGSILYTGEGGQDRKKKQIKDQCWQSYGNAALLLSEKTKKPIRVLRGTMGEYHYLGLYTCEEHTYEPGLHGFKVFKFKLVPLKVCQSAVARSLRLAARRSVKSMASPKTRSSPSTPRNEMPTPRLSSASGSEERKRNDHPTLSGKAHRMIAKSEATLNMRSCPPTPRTAPTPLLSNEPISEEEQSDSPTPSRKKTQAELLELHNLKLQKAKELEMAVFTTNASIREEPKSFPKHFEPVIPMVRMVLKADPDVDELQKFHIPKRKRTTEAQTKAEDKQEIATVHVPRKSTARPDFVLSHCLSPDPARRPSLIENMPSPSTFRPLDNNKRRRYR